MNVPKNSISGIDTLEGALVFAAELEAKLSQIAPYGKQIGRACDRIQEAIARLRADSEYVVTTEVCEEFEEEVNRYYSALMNCVNAVYYVASQPITIYGLRNEYTADREDAKRIGSDMLGIAARVWEGKILIKMPMLGRRVSYTGAGYGGGGVSYDYSKVYAADVARAVRILVEDELLNYEEFYHKTMSFFYVYPKDAKSVLDSDSHDTKAIIDAVALQLPGGDSARCCSFSYSSAFRDDLPEGTYICVSPEADKPQKGTILDAFCTVFQY